MDFKHLKEIRKSKHMTLATLGEKTGYTASFLSQIERGLNRPSIEALRKICDVLEIEVASLLASHDDVNHSTGIETHKGYKIFREPKETLYQPWQSSATYYHTLFNTPIHSDNMIASKIIIDAHSSSSGQLISHNLTEINYIISGEATIELTDEQQILREGDAIYLDSFTNHNVKNDSDEPLVLFTLQF
ncbi:helix-turn-helix transcriptional regulator [Vagococcus sp. DIV0080]|jgi:transcriptional regulator with XRE-family HTH domain|uniref:Helix-turn-helix transcriptional regulator n=1 Tax=Candidatus Vagococcus giribetii TaxID=2230876 RepID=A0ABS3HQ74_9ENTE|nr:helix-turn-helix domain-containing protein [Vagococcus sp. DIV0080]MBO0475902.1 helix-turn-helix transcriptional regulator [Vagococcus sp. DIV0080]